MTQDVVYYADKDIQVTSSVIRIRGFTYALKNVTSYRAVYGGGTIYTMLPFLLGLVLLALYIPPHNQFGIGCGIALLFWGILNIFLCKTLYIVTSAGQGRGYTTYNRARLYAVMQAIDQAMSNGGL